jgi:carbamoyl-phosphate synthase large subunit
VSSTQKIKKAVIFGSGGLRIGQAGEFDYSGSQAIKALKEEGIETVLINPNIATVQTDDDMADRVYFQPLQVESVSKILAREKPDAVLLSFGGQTALNLGLALHEQGILKKYKIRVLGTKVDAIKITEDRDLFKSALGEIGVKTARSKAVYTVEQAVKAAVTIGFPVMMRSAFSLGGLGSGKVDNERQLRDKVGKALGAVSQILIEEYLEGWKEIEYEVVRDRSSNTITVCNMENLDPMGIHTGESIVVAPSQTLTNQEYHHLREVAIRTINHLGIIGECNIQYALNPASGDYRVIEVNARLSRSSALASKATGYPLAFIATKLMLGYRLDELTNSVTGQTPAFFEPALDYLAVKVPRWDLAKLKSSDHQIGTEMKSVGEVMAIGRSFTEALQKAIRMLNIGANGLTDHPYVFKNTNAEIGKATDRRIFALYEAIKNGTSVEAIHKISRIDPWFLMQVEIVVRLEAMITYQKKLDKRLLLTAKQHGFSDLVLAKILNQTEKAIRKLRQDLNVLPSIKQIDTLAGEFEAATNYLYMTYHGVEHDVPPLGKKAITVIGAGPYSIGASVEFDWSAVNTVKTLRANKHSTIMINSNPETVSTDFDRSDRLYFEELTQERVRDIIDYEKTGGIVVSVGGQIANNLALALYKAKYPVLGTSPVDIDRAENRQKFSTMLNKLQIDQPAWREVTSLQSARQFAKKVGYPVLLRPSYVLSGGAMNIVTTDQELKTYLEAATRLSPDHPVVISRFITEAKELEIDGVAKDGHLIIYAISEHIENAGVHSGDATVVLPPQRLYLETVRRAKHITKQIVAGLNITGPFNVQFIAKDNELMVIECNVRSARSFPFVSKVTGYNFIKVATEAMLGLENTEVYQTLELDYVAVKSPQFSYNRLKGADPVAGVEMASTGEVACFGKDLNEAFYTSWLATDQSIKNKSIFLSLPGTHKAKFLEETATLATKGWRLFTTPGTHKFLKERGVKTNLLYKIQTNRQPNIATFIARQKLGLMINIPSVAKDTLDAFTIRRLAVDNHIPLVTNAETGRLLMRCLGEIDPDTMEPRSWQEFLQA